MKKMKLWMLNLDNLRRKSKTAEIPQGVSAVFVSNIPPRLAKLAIIVSKLAKFAENGVKLLHIPKKVTTFAAYYLTI